MKKVIKLKEQDLQNIIRESVNRILKESNSVEEDERDVEEGIDFYTFIDILKKHGWSYSNNYEKPMNSNGFLNCYVVNADSNKSSDFQTLVQDLKQNAVNPSVILVGKRTAQSAPEIKHGLIGVQCRYVDNVYEGRTKKEGKKFNIDGCEYEATSVKRGGATHPGFKWVDNEKHNPERSNRYRKRKDGYRYTADYEGKPNTLHKNLTQMNENYDMARNIVKQTLTKIFGSTKNIDITLGELINIMENNGYLLKHRPEETINHECYIFSDQNNELDINCIVYNPTLNPQEQIHIESFDIEPNY